VDYISAYNEVMKMEGDVGVTLPSGIRVEKRQGPSVGIFANRGRQWYYSCQGIVQRMFVNG